MNQQPKAWIIAALNRTFEESGERNPDGSTDIRVSLLRSIAKRYDWESVKSVLKELEISGAIKVWADPETADSPDFACIGAYIHEPKSS